MSTFIQTPTGKIPVDELFAEEAALLGMPVTTDAAQTPGISPPAMRQGEPQSASVLDQFLARSPLIPSNAVSQLGRKYSDEVRKTRARSEDKEGDSSLLRDLKALNRKADNSVASVLERLSGAAKDVGGRVVQAKDYATIPKEDYEKKYTKSDGGAYSSPMAKSMMSGGAAKGVTEKLAESDQESMPILTPSVARAAEVVPDATAEEITVASAIDRGDPMEIANSISSFRKSEGKSKEKKEKKDWGRILGILGFTMSSVSNRPGATFGEALGASMMAVHGYFDDLEQKALAADEKEAARQFQWAKQQTEQANKDRDYALKVRAENRQGAEAAMRAQQNSTENALKLQKMVQDSEQFKATQDRIMLEGALEGHRDFGTDATDDILHYAASGNQYAQNLADSRIREHLNELGAIYAADGQHDRRSKSKTRRYLRNLPPAMVDRVYGALQIAARDGDASAKEQAQPLLEMLERSLN